MCKKQILFLMTVLYCFLYLFAGSDTGGRCERCGKLTMRGGSHLCRPKKTFYRKATYNKSAPKAISNSEKANTKSGEEEQKESKLPPFRYGTSNYEVIGVAIVPSEDTPQLCCKDNYASGERYFSINEGRAAQYYKRHCAIIPVIGLKGSYDPNSVDRETTTVAIEKLNIARTEAKERLKAQIKEEKQNFKKFHTPLKCISAFDQTVEDSELVRKWTNKKGVELHGVWIANYNAYNVDGIVIINKENKKLVKIPINVLCDEDAKYVNDELKNSDVKRFPLVTKHVEEGSLIEARFKRAGVKDLKFEAVFFAEGNDENSELVNFIQIYPGGQICEYPIEANEKSSRYDIVEYSSSSRSQHNKLNSANKEWTLDEVAKGPVYVLQHNFQEAKKMQEEAKKMQEEAGKRQEREKPFRDNYAQLMAKWSTTCELAEIYNPERSCEVHKWQEKYAPRFNGDLYTHQQKNDYAQNYMKALELMDKGLLECTCNNSLLKQKYWKALDEANEIHEKLEKLKSEYPDIDFQR